MGRKAVTTRTFTIEEITAVFPQKSDLFGELAHGLHNLSDVIVVLAVPRSGRGVEEVVTTGEELEDLRRKGYDNDIVE